MTNSPLAANHIARRSIVFPVPATPVAQGDCVRTRMHILPADTMVSWIVEVRRAGSARAACRFERSTLRGMLLAPDRLRRTRPDFVPKLTERGVARGSVLTLCDGHRTLAEIEREMLARHPELFSDLGAAAAFVAEVVSGYSA
jgi:hypothetical protein